MSGGGSGRAGCDEDAEGCGNSWRATSNGREREWERASSALLCKTLITHINVAHIFNNQNTSSTYYSVSNQLFSPAMPEYEEETSSKLVFTHFFANSALINRPFGSRTCSPRRWTLPVACAVRSAAEEIRNKLTFSASDKGKGKRS